MDSDDYLSSLDSELPPGFIDGENVTGTRHLAPPDFFAPSMTEDEEVQQRTYSLLKDEEVRRDATSRKRKLSDSENNVKSNHRMMNSFGQTSASAECPSNVESTRDIQNSEILPAHFTTSVAPQKVPAEEDDMEIISLTEASPAAQRRWNEYKSSSANTGESFRFVKQETSNNQPISMSQIQPSNKAHSNSLNLVNRVPLSQSPLFDNRQSRLSEKMDLESKQPSMPQKSLGFPYHSTGDTSGEVRDGFYSAIQSSLHPNTHLKNNTTAGHRAQSLPMAQTISRSQRDSSSNDQKEQDLQFARQNALLKSKPTGTQNIKNRSNFDGEKERAEMTSKNPLKRSFVEETVGTLEGNSAPSNEILAESKMEDDSWMHEELGEDGELTTLREKLDILLRRKRSGKINSRENVELRDVQQRINVLERLQGQGNIEQEEPEEGLFVNETNNDVVARHIRDLPQVGEASKGIEPDGELQDDDFDLDEGPNTSMDQSGSPDLFGDLIRQDPDHDSGVASMINDLNNGVGLIGPSTRRPRGARKPKTKPVPRSKTARDRYQVDQNKAAAKEAAKAEKQRAKLQKNKGNASAGPSKKPATRSKPKGPGKAPATGRGRAVKAVSKKSPRVASGSSLIQSRKGAFQKQKLDETTQRLLEDLRGSDPIADRLTNPIFNVSAEPLMEGNMPKATQIQRLYSNIPEGSNKSAARGDRAKLLAASKAFGYGKVRAQDGKWLVKGMKSTLYHHQLLGSKWMLERELSSDEPHGGLLADSMGLGKTVQTLACMVANPPTSKDIERKVKATLIIAPASVCAQWVEEIKVHTDQKTFPKVLRYHGGKSGSGMTIEILQDLDIVVCSYNDIMKQFSLPKGESLKSLDAGALQDWWDTEEGKLGLLHEVTWYRIVLDEAHYIKNNSGRTSLACQNLKAVYRWCLTATPLLNRIEELFPYLRFLKAKYSMDWDTFRKYFCDPHAEKAQARIGLLLSYTMMRRNMKDTILNRPIITLPQPHPIIRYTNFSAHEKIIYRITESRFRACMNSHLQGGHGAKGYSVYMVQLLRLRQCTSHSFMLEDTIKSCWTLEDVEELKLRLSQINQLDAGRSFYEQTKIWVQKSVEQRNTEKALLAEGNQREITTVSGSMDDAGELLPFGRGTYGRSFDMSKAFDNLQMEEFIERITCGVCYDHPAAAKKTDCGHIFCNECIRNKMHQQIADGEEFYTCPSCDRLFESLENIDVPEVDGDGEQEPEGTGQKSKSKLPLSENSMGRDLFGFEPRSDSNWLKKTDDDPDFPLAPSAKTGVLKSLLLRGFQEAPYDKVVIYVQFLTLARIIGRILNQEKYGFLYLTGELSLEQRTKVVKQFKVDADTKILVAGLKCGGVGLNFPWANRCFSLDLWWNHAVEQQAFGRIFRLGQTKETYMTRIIVRDTVDERLLAMQMDKLKNCERAIDGNADARERPKLSLHQLLNLFGFLKTDADNNILSVEPDYHDQAEWDAGGAGNLDDTTADDGSQ